MSIAPRLPIPDLFPENAPFTPEQRTWLNGFFAGFISLEGGAITPLSAAESAALMSGGPAAFQAPDGGDGATGLRTMRIQLSGLFRRAFLKKRRAAESLRARRQGDRPHAQDP